MYSTMGVTLQRSVIHLLAIASLIGIFRNQSINQSINNTLIGLRQNAKPTLHEEMNSA